MKTVVAILLLSVTAAFAQDAAPSTTITNGGNALAISPDLFIDARATISVDVDSDITFCGGGKAIVTIHKDGSVDLHGNKPDAAAMEFWKAVELIKQQTAQHP